MKESILAEKTLAFAVRIVNLYKFLDTEQKEHIMSKQVLRSGTSIGANVNEANFGQSKADFISKLQIALKETAETEYWIKVLMESEYIEEKISISLISDCIAIKKLLIASINTAKENI